MKKVVKIGAVYPLSGSLSSIGEDIKKALLLAQDISNHSKQLPEGLDTLNCFTSTKYKIELVFGDSQGDPVIGVQEARRLISEEGVSALIGAYQSSVTDATSLLAETLEIPYVNPESSAPTLTQRGLKWFFRTGADDVLYTRLMFELFRFLKDVQGQDLSTFGILSEGSEFGLEASAVEIADVKGFGGEVTAFEPYSTPSSLEAAILRILRANPQVVLAQQFLSDAIMTVTTLKAVNWFPDGFVVQNAGYVIPEFLETVGNDGNYIISRASWALGLGKFKPIVTEVNRLYKKRYQENMNETNARSFTGMMVLIDGINRAGSQNPYKIRRALRLTNIPGSQLIMPWQGVRFNEEGQNILADGLLVQILNQKYRIIWPLHFKEKNVVWPAPSWEERGIKKTRA
ncbi:ABC transporter substrate-binding protein [Halobacillus massiliensis]|uniref:ABC transporter substrate-binding protein n=1 Tax=Halobacillus massiliensis TaxID=1926286 RepID=UPI0009E4D944|nr:ABC transporter substrate-binding protein [Halobacillus massiliensis]